MCTCCAGNVVAILVRLKCADMDAGLRELLGTLHVSRPVTALRATHVRERGTHSCSLSDVACTHTYIYIYVCIYIYIDRY